MVNGGWSWRLSLWRWVVVVLVFVVVEMVGVVLVVMEMLLTDVVLDDFYILFIRTTVCFLLLVC